MGYRRSCGAQVQGKRSASFVMTVACAADVRFVVVDPNLGVTSLAGMPFGEKKRLAGAAARQAHHAALSSASGSLCLHVNRVKLKSIILDLHRTWYMYQ